MNAQEFRRLAIGQVPIAATLLVVLPLAIEPLGAQVNEPGQAVTQSDDVKTNRLAQETSPYLLQHKSNPVDWYPWGKEAFEKATREDKPIFLSIGYAACHWCHVMEHESFENGEIASYLNTHFVSIKVDREERPDIDEIYMRAVQAMQQHGGWPLSVWLTKDGKPFAGGTYFPPQNFLRVLQSIQSHWKTNREGIDGNAEKVAQWVRDVSDATDPIPWPENLDEAARTMLARNYDEVWGGFYGPPKFPHSNDLRLLLRHHLATGDEKSLAMVDHTLTMMWRGGMYDHVGGGFHRYSVDEKWLVPHFEKMLYDNALLACTYTEAWLVTHDDRYRRVTCEILDYVRREMTSEGGGFYSTTDADSEGEEGLFFVWTPEGLAEVLGETRAERFATVYGVTSAGNFEHGRSILHLPRTLDERAQGFEMPVEELERELRLDREKLHAKREERVHPLLDDKILADWNGLMITAFVRAAQAFGRDDYLEAAERALAFAFRTFRTEEGALLHVHRAGITKVDGMLADHAYLLEAALETFLATGNERTFDDALWLAGRLRREFEDEHEGSFFHTGKSSEALIARFKDSTDGATPNPAAIATKAFATLYHLTGDRAWHDVARNALRAAARLAQRAPQAHASFLLAAHWLEPTVRTCVLTRGEGLQELRAELGRTLRANTLVVQLPPEPSEGLSRRATILAGKSSDAEGRARAYVCHDFTCELPVTTASALRERLASPRK